jgi:hypothetical protein
MNHSIFWTSFILLCATYLSLGQSSWRAPHTATTGVIRLEVLTDSCAALSPQLNRNHNLGSQQLNDGRLDPFELVAIREGCLLRAVAIAPNGMRLTDIPLLLFRLDATSGDSEVFGGSRNTDDYGSATWTFPLTPHTNFIYYVESPSPTKLTVRSNFIEIALCTGEESARLVPETFTADFGRGCY